jgi:hypothetical protein
VRGIRSRPEKAGGTGIEPTTSFKTVTSALLSVGALAALVVIARGLGFRRRRESYRFAAAVAVGILALGALTDVGAEIAPLVIVPVGAAGLWLASRLRKTERSESCGRRVD